MWSTDECELREILEQREIDTTQDKTWSQLVDHALTNYVEPRLIEPTFLYDYPVALSPFARLVDGSDEIVERFEGYIGGTEICNAFSELNDPDDQASRFEAQVARKARGAEETMDYDADYIRALEHGMPPAAGFGMGIDRLVMMLTHSASIRDVIFFPLLRPESGAAP